MCGSASAAGASPAWAGTRSAPVCTVIYRIGEYDPRRQAYLLTWPAGLREPMPRGSWYVISVAALVTAGLLALDLANIGFDGTKVAVGVLLALSAYLLAQVISLKRRVTELERNAHQR